MIWDAEILVLKPIKMRCSDCPRTTLYRVTRSKAPTQAVYACKTCLTSAEEMRLITLGRAFR